MKKPTDKGRRIVIGAIVSIGMNWHFIDVAFGDEPQKSKTIIAPNTPFVVEPNTPVAGQPLPVWIQRYWQWARSFPPGESPSDDTTGANCNIGQSQPVFFLTGTSKSDSVSRECSVPQGQYIFVPLINVLAQTDTPSPKVTCDDFLKAVRQVNDSVADLAVTINGQPIESPTLYKGESGCFDLRDTSTGVSGKAAGAGYWIVLKPLDVGDYELRFSGRYQADGFKQDVRYQLRVEPQPVADRPVPKGPGCKLNPDNSITIGECVAQIRQSYDEELNETYSKLLSELTERGKQAPQYRKAKAQIVSAQKQWMRFRDLDCGALLTRYPNDPAVGGKHSVCMMQRTEQRLKEIHQWFNW
jgi:uncharacterized protein YecT (DUF1311 family)